MVKRLANPWKRSTVAARCLAILRAIADWWREKGYGPAHKDIAAALGGMNNSVINYNVRSLAAKGFVKFEPNVSRSTRLTPAGQQHLIVQAQKQKEAKHGTARMDN
jgi:SOS-response transcriptional repressor LexA